MECEVTILEKWGIIWIKKYNSFSNGSCNLVSKYLGKSHDKEDDSKDT